MGRHENPLDASASPVAELADALRRLRRAAGNPPYQRMARHCSYSVATLSRAAAGKQLPTLAVLLAYVEACGVGDTEAWETRWRHAAKALAAQRPGRGNPPYKGLARFDPTDQALYFGRDRLVDDLWTLTCDRRVSALIGPSGSGKSSLLRAGLVPRLRGREESPRRPATIRIITPGERPLSTHGPHLSSTGTRPSAVFLIVDQFEELFTLCHDPVEREEFVKALLADRGPSGGIRVVLGIRADFVPRCLDHPGLASVVRDASLTVTRMSSAELREAIVGPARAHGLVVERALTARLTADVADNTFELPLLSHALLETWTRRQGRTLTLDAYERAGGLQGAIAQSAEGVYTRLDTVRADITRQILLRMITPGSGKAPDTRRSVTRAELESLGGDQETHEVLESLTRARLITSDGASVGLAHEALINAWPRLGDWIERDRENMRVQRWLTEAADAWDAVGREPGVRISPVRLAQLDAHASRTGRSGLTTLETDFLAAGLATHRRTLRARRTTRAMGSLLVATTTLAASALWRQRRLFREHRAQR
ncbi:helix-turn-helix domain-containing protein [Streptomyces sp. NBC_01255]|uniref:nSTAND1 domain-containing NTPase n=1 Tax=Streptomyces sp. NBC_01255 TaxID=2903798 RepID=UPI002E36CC1C|nr:helix-turn-helix domain-containing protein [Streptomyces sp. NBC_01255]